MIIPYCEDEQHPTLTDRELRILITAMNIAQDTIYDCEGEDRLGILDKALIQRAKEVELAIANFVRYCNK